MDTSSVQSNSRCGSDFSIERILSSDTRSNGDNVVIPDWLCCTRYKPPRLPRAVSGGSRARRSGRHARVPFTAAQAAALEAAYARSPYLAPPALRALAAALHLRDDRIKIWFQNRRARERREKSGNIAPPIAVTLPPTTIPHAVLMTPCSWSSLQTVPHHQDPDHEVLRPNDMERISPDTNEMKLNGSSLNLSDDRPETPLDIETVED